jgi:glycosyltransferase involved in cell wall biosynthesis
VSGIPELIDDGATGLLVEPEAPEKLAQALEMLLREPARRRLLGEAGRRRVWEKFGLDGNIARLARRFGLTAAE